MASQTPPYMRNRPLDTPDAVSIQASPIYTRPAWVFCTPEAPWKNFGAEYNRMQSAPAQSDFDLFGGPFTSQTGLPTTLGTHAGAGTNRSRSSPEAPDVNAGVDCPE